MSSSHAPLHVQIVTIYTGHMRGLGIAVFRPSGGHRQVVHSEVEFYYNV